MIKINLLSEGRRPVVARKSKASFDFGGQDPNNALLLAGVVLGALVAGAWWYRLNAEMQEYDRRIRAAQARYEELRPIIEQVDKFKQQNQDLENKVGIIKSLKAAQEGPVNVMDAISLSLPELVWLESMTVVGKQINLRGKAFNTNAVAAFIENITEVSWSEEGPRLPREDEDPEELDSVFEEPSPRNIRITGRADESYGFDMSFAFKPRPVEASEEEPVGESG